MFQRTSKSDRPQAFVLIIHLACAHDVRLPYVNEMQVPRAGDRLHCFSCERDVEVVSAEVVPAGGTGL